MAIKVGTFNLNNLFSRFNFAARVDQLPDGDDGGISLTLGPDDVMVRTFAGRLVREKDPDDTTEIARRIVDVMNADVLAVQEVEHIINREHLGGSPRRMNRLFGRRNHGGDGTDHDPAWIELDV